MIQVISFPYDGTDIEDHEEGLKNCGKTYWIGLAIDNYLETAGIPFVLPELMIADFSCLDNLNRLAQQNSFKFLHEVPAIVVYAFDREPPRSAVKDFNMIGRMTTKDQFEPENFVRLIRAFDAAKQNGPVTRETFERALAGETNAAGGAGRPQTERSGAVFSPAM